MPDSGNHLPIPPKSAAQALLTRSYAAAANGARRADQYLLRGVAAWTAGWLEQLATSHLPALASLAKAIREDQHAVVQGITTRFNSGVNEGRITDLNRDTKIDLRFADLRGSSFATGISAVSC